MKGLLHLFIRTFLVLLVVALAASNARHLAGTENNQFEADQEPNLFEPVMKQLQMELMAQKLAEMNNPIGFQRDLRAETDRKRRFRACYFNPVSCFKK